MMRWLVLASLLISSAASAATANLPANSVLYLPVLKEEIVHYWPDLFLYSALAGQVEQETCISLKSKGCWNPKTELKTSYEYGFGLGQLTVTKRFNAWREVKGMDSSLATWQWTDRYNPRYQLRALVLKDRYNAKRFPLAASQLDELAFALAAYNGGLGGTLNDIVYCKATRGCDPTKWFDNVEHTSHKARLKRPGYGQSAFEINRGYVQQVLKVRRLKYEDVMGDQNR